MGSTLIIHPQDSSTTFLDIIYKDMKDATLITGGVSKSDVVQLIIEHDRVMMMGHGSPGGLFAMGQFKTYAPYIIDYTTVPYLNKKTDNVFIWCNADKFVTYYGLQGFYSGMFISEVVEATYCGLPGMSQDIVDESNYGFCELISKYINQDKFNIYENIKKEYGLLAENNPVALYNHKRLYAT
jgi:hypothetical protein